MNIEISTDRLGADINKMQDNLDNLRRANQQVMGSVEQLSTMWEGRAHNAFMAQVRMDQLILLDLTENIGNLIECMEFAKSEYERCEGDVNSKIASIRLSGDT